jgi:hypothetical protein
MTVPVPTVTPRLRPYDLIIEQGSDFEVTWNLGDLLDTSEWTAAGQIRAYATAEDVLHELDVTVVDKVVTLKVPAAVSAAWEFRAGVYDLEVSSASLDRVMRVAKGRVRVDAEITR